MRKLIKVEEVDEFDIYDITVNNDHCFELENGIIAHNSLFPKDIVSGGTGSYYSSANIFIIGRQQDKTGKELEGYNFVINVEKSRYVREKSKIPININFETGISKYSGLLDIALELGYIQKPSNGWYSRVDPDTGEVEEKKFRAKDTNTKEFWNMLLNNEKFKESIRKRYQIAYGDIMEDDNEKEISD